MQASTVARGLGSAQLPQRGRSASRGQPCGRRLVLRVACQQSVDQPGKAAPSSADCVLLEGDPAGACHSPFFSRACPSSQAHPPLLLQRLMPLSSSQQHLTQCHRCQWQCQALWTSKLSLRLSTPDIHTRYAAARLSGICTVNRVASECRQ